MKHHFSLPVLFLASFLPCFAEQRITFFVRTFPALEDEVDVNKLLQDAVDPQKISHHILRAEQLSYPFNGLMGSYAGYFTVSSPFNGQMSFPRKQQKPLLHYVVTPNVEPVIMLGKTVHHLELIKGMPAAFYSAQRKQDPDTEYFYWTIQPEQLPADGVIPLSAIVLFAKPKNVRIVPGIFNTIDGPQLQLPDVYVRKGIDLISGAFSVLKIKHFFRSIVPVYKKGTAQSWITQITE